jgi:hypothetical protein
MVSIRAFATVGLLVALAGCGGEDMHEVIGRITDRAGGPLSDVRVVFIEKDKSLTATAETDKDGAYRIGARRVGGGSPLGKYTVLVIEDAPVTDSARGPTPRIAKRYSDPALSGLEVHVKPGRNRFDFQLDPQ